MNSFFGSTDYRMTRAALVATAAIYPLVTLPWRIAGWLGGSPLVHVGRIPGAGGPNVPDPPARPGVDVRFSDQVVWTVADASAAQWLASLVPALLTTALVILACVVAWRLATRTQRGEPFSPAAVRQLRVLGVALMAYGLVAPVLRALVDVIVVGGESGPGVAWVLDLATLAPFLAGTVVLVLAESFRVGDRLRSDVEGLV